MGSEPEVVHLIILTGAANAHTQVMSRVNKINHGRVINLHIKTEMGRPKTHSRAVPRREVNDRRWSASYCHKPCTVLEFPYAAWLKMLQNIEYIRAATFWQQAEKCCGWGENSLPVQAWRAETHTYDEYTHQNTQLIRKSKEQYTKYVLHFVVRYKYRIRTSAQWT